MVNSQKHTLDVLTLRVRISIWVEGKMNSEIIAMGVGSVSHEFDVT